MCNATVTLVYLYSRSLPRSTRDIVNQGVLEVSDRMLYDVEKNRKPVPNGAVDPRLVSIY